MAVHDRTAGKHPTPLSPRPNKRRNPLSSIEEAGPKPDKKKDAMLAAFKGRH